MGNPAALRFSGPDAVRAVFGLVPADVLAAGGTVHRGDDGSLVIAAPLPAAVRRALTAAGAEAVGAPASGGRPFVHWAELVPLVPDPDPDLREVLFVLPPGAPWLPLAAELVRLGCDAVELARLDRDDWVLRARRPPFYTVARAATGAWTAFARHGSAFCEVGFRHPLAGHLTHAAADRLVLLGRDGWRIVGIDRWTELLEQLELVLPPPVPVRGERPTDRLQVRLRLKPAPRAASPTLWRVTDPVDATLDRLLATLPEAVTERLLFARYTLPDGTDGALLRARPGTAPPALEGLVPYGTHPHLPAVHVPAGRTVDPPLHARTLAELLDPGPGTVAWLEPTGPDGTGIRVHQVAEDAFQPLRDWVVYHADRDLEQVRAWMGSAVFDWAPLDLPIARDPREERPADPAPSRSSRAARRPVAAAEPEPEPAATPVAPSVAPIEVAPIPGAPRASEAEEALHALQAQWKRDPSRDDAWAPMAELHHALGQHREAALCWTRALWDQPPPARREIARRWVAALPERTDRGIPDDPGSADLAAVVAHLMAEDRTYDPPALQRWLEAHDRPLDVRGRWLARRRAAELAGGDALALARARDEVLASMRAGLAPWRDVPAFLRSSTSEEERRWLASSLAGLPERLEPLIPNEAPRDCTRAYARLVVAWAEACLGLDGPVREAVAAAERALPLGDPIHRVLLGLYRAGIDEALAGLPAETPPPPEVSAALDALEPFARYKVQRLQDASVAVLAEAGAADAFSNWVRREKRASFGALPPEQLLPAIHAHLEALDADQPAPALLEVLHAAAGLEEAQALPILERVIATAVGLAETDSVPVLVEAASLAAAIHRPEALDGAPLDALERGMLALLRSQPAAVVDPARDLARSLIRCRLAPRGIALFTALRDAVPRDASAVRLRICGALAQLGGGVGDEASEALTKLADRSLPRSERIAIVAATADLATPLPVDQAVALWNALVPQADIPDAFSTNTHFALSFLQVVEIIAAAHVHPDRLLGPEGRALLEADEHRVRQRIHREERP